MIFRDEGKLPQAVKWFERAVELKDCDANLELANVYLMMGEKKKAIRYLKRVLNCEPADVTRASVEKAQRLLQKIG